jgi:hypothetical protein
MPNIFRKSNRSHQSVDNSSSGQPSPVPSGKGAFDSPTVRAADEQALAVNEQVAAQRYQPSDGQQAPIQAQQPPVQQQSPGVPQGQYREQFPQRTPSHRMSAHLPLSQSSQNYQQQPGQPSLALEAPRRGSYQPLSSPVTYTPEPPKKQSLRSRIAAGVKGHKDQEAKAQKNGLGRKVSVRKSDPRIQDYRVYEDNRWQQQQGSSLHLPASNEQDEDNLDLFLQQDSRDSPQVPPKDIQYQQPQQFAPPQPHQEQYNRPPPLGRLSTEGSYSTQGGVDQYSPEHLQGQVLQPTAAVPELSAFCCSAPTELERLSGVQPSKRAKPLASRRAAAWARRSSSGRTTELLPVPTAARFSATAKPVGIR